ncbi:MAG: hypothetical protein Kow0010_15150 [Dehalococcoidia bacterium]
MVTEAVSLINRARTSESQLALSVNLSAWSLSTGDLMRLVEEELAESGITPGLLTFELTETVAMQNIEHARRLCHQLRELGCRIAIDDFGVGFSSFRYLKQLPFDVLKIDGSFVQNLALDETDQRLVRAMVDVARALGVETVAEWVTSERSLSVLRQLGVDCAQGFHIGRPIPVDEVLAARQGGRTRLSA